MPAHKLLGKDLAFFYLGCFFIWSIDFKSPGFKFIHNPHSQGQLRPYHGQADFVVNSPVSQLYDLGLVDWYYFGDLGQTAIARCRIELLAVMTLLYFPGKSMFTSP